ncbi:MAG: AAA-like domain-containing protein [Woeseiaceae bacterium]
MTGKTDEQQPDHDRAKLDATGEFFSVGTPLHAVRAGYVRRVADDVLYETIRSGRYAHVIAPDRSGKSSLIAATAARLENNGYKVAVLDFEQIGARDAGEDAGRWNYSVAYRLLRQLRIRADLQTWWQDKSILQNRQRLLEFFSEIILQNVSERIVIFVDEIQCIGDLPFADQLLASFRAAHNARATDPDFSRLTFVLLGECDPLSLIDEPELSPFNVTQAVTLEDFSREELNLFITELNLPAEDAALALDRIYYWTSGQPYLSQKLARAVAREQREGDIAAIVDGIALHQLSGRSALHNEPHMSHIHREVVKNPKQSEALLNLYGRICKKVAVATDLGSTTQRRLIALGLLVIDDEGRLKIRNRLYRSVFTARWANENLPNHWRAPAVAAAAILVALAIPFWYTQILPQSYVDTMTSNTAELTQVQNAYQSFHTFPGHVEVAENLYRNVLRNRAAQTADTAEIEQIAELAAAVPDSGTLADELLSSFWDRQAREARRGERRDAALLATIESLSLSTSQRRGRAASLVADDYPLLLASLPTTEDRGNLVFNPGSMLLTESKFANVSQWSLVNQNLQQSDDWKITALEVTPLVRRVIVDRDEVLRRVGLTLNLSHVRVSDLRIKVIAPSGRTVEVDAKVDRAFANEDLHIESAQLADLLGESIFGTWSLSIRDEELGVAGQLVGWNLNLNSQGLIEDFQRGLNISDPVERETENIWFSSDGRFAVARAMQSDSARIWDLAFAKPVRAIAVNELEQFIGLSARARQLVTATQDSVNLWDTATGQRVATLNVGAASGTSSLTADGTHLLVQRRSDEQTTFELWSLDDADISASLTVAGTPAVVSLDSTGHRIAVADFDRAVRVWDMQRGGLITQIDLAAQPSRLELAAGGEVLGIVYGEDGASVWRIDEAVRPILDDDGHGKWQMAFSDSGSKVLVGRPSHGFQIYDTNDGNMIGPVIGSGGDPLDENLLGFSSDELTVVTGGPASTARFWRVPATPAATDQRIANRYGLWPPAGDAVAILTPDASKVVVGDQAGNVHFLPADGGPESFMVTEEVVSFLGHSGKVRLMAVSADGARVASVANDNSIRVWDTQTGLPQSFFGEAVGSSIESLVFSPDASILAILGGNQVQIIDAEDGSELALFELAEQHQSLAFADSERLFIGSENGTLRVINREAPGNWVLQSLWQGDSPIRWLEASPQGRYLVFIDQGNLAQQFILAEGKLGEQSLRLPGAVEDVSFSPNGSRVLFRTARWIHRASSAAAGLRWQDAVFASRAVSGSRMVFGDVVTDSAAPLGNRVFIPVSANGYVQLASVGFDGTAGASLFGNKSELLAEWRDRLGLD